MARSSAQAKNAGPVLLSIGQVLAKLSPEFPDLTPSKLRFLEEQGLVAPSRTPSGYRKFSSDDLERLVLVLTMQRDRYLPLKVIRDYLEERDAGLSPMLPGAPVVGSHSMLSTSRRLTRDELVREASATPQLLAEAVSASLLPPAEVYADDSLRVLKALVELRSRGIEPRHLRTVRAAIEREIGLIESAVAPARARRDATGRAKASEAAREISRQLDIVRGSLLRAAIDRMLP